MKNKNSYSADKTVNYYKKLSLYGLFNYEKQLIEEYFEVGRKILDIGCGAGRTSFALSKMGYKVVGIDYSENMIEIARTLDTESEYFIQDVRNMSFQSCLFDYAFFSFNGLMLLETYEDRKKAVWEISRILKNEGIFFFTTPFLDNKVKKEYWVKKVTIYSKSLEELSKQERIELGDDIIEEDEVEFQLHIPFLNEIREMLDECGFDILFEGRRLDIFLEEELEDELDDNYLWVVICKNVQL